MNAQHDKSMANEPWRPVPPTSNDIPNDAVVEGPYSYWVVGEPGNLRVMCAGLPVQGGVAEVIKSEWPDEIFDRMKALDPSIK